MSLSWLEEVTLGELLHMATFKLVLGTKDGRSHKKDVAEDAAEQFIGKKIGDTITGEMIGLDGYEFLITGGSDYCGFPMRRDVQGPARRRILAISGVGLKKKEKGLRQRKTVAGNTIHAKTAQINLKVVKQGTQPLGGAAGAQAAQEEPAKEGEKK